MARRALVRDSPSLRPTVAADWQRRLTLLGLAEDQVWRRVVNDLALDAASPAGRVMAYAFSEMLNNAVDHSGSDAASIAWWRTDDRWCFEIEDQGVGVYRKLRDGLGLGSEFEAVEELSKGKRTTDPSRHTGEGIFFTSKVVDLFRLTSTGIRWTVDNLRHDTALGEATYRPGTSAFCEIDPRATRRVADVFDAFTDGHRFTRTRPLVKLFEIGTTFVSRSEARRLLDGLAEDFDDVDVDFAGVDDVGQGFVDELLRVWPNAHPGKRVNPVNMNRVVEFMVRRVSRP